LTDVPDKPLAQRAQAADLARLAAIPLFRTLGLVARGKLLEAGRVLGGPCEETLHGPASLVVVLGGSADLRTRYADTADAHPAPVQRLSTGDHSPLHACLDGRPYAQTLILSPGARVLVLPRALLEQTMAQHPRLGRAILLQLARRLRVLNEGLSDVLDLGVAGDRNWRHALAAVKYRELCLVPAAAGRRLLRFFTGAHYRNPALWMFLGFVLAVMFSRLVVGTIIAYGLETRFFNLIATDGDLVIHIHHFNYGLALLLGVALALLFPRARRRLLPLAAVYGFGLGLFVDEIGLVTNLSPDYFQAASAIGITAVTAFLVWLIYYFGRREAQRP